MLSKRFPFGIYYEMEDDVVYLYAIQDCGVIRFDSGTFAGEKSDELSLEWM